MPKPISTKGKPNMAAMPSNIDGTRSDTVFFTETAPSLSRHAAMDSATVWAPCKNIGTYNQSTLDRSPDMMNIEAVTTSRNSIGAGHGFDSLAPLYAITKHTAAVTMAMR